MPPLAFVRKASERLTGDCFSLWPWCVIACCVWDTGFKLRLFILDKSLCFQSSCQINPIACLSSSTFKAQDQDGDRLLIISTRNESILQNRFCYICVRWNLIKETQAPYAADIWHETWTGLLADSLSLTPYCSVMIFVLLVFLPDGTLGRRSVFTLRGWAGTRACWSPPPWLASLSSCTASSLWNPAKSGQLTLSVPPFKLRCHSLTLHWFSQQ